MTRALQPRRALTLIEMLVVVALIAIVTAMTAVSLSRTADGAGLLKTLAACRELDARGRLLARTCGSAAVLRFDEERGRLTLSTEQGSEVVAERALPLHYILRLEANDASANNIVFDRLGRTQDYAFVLTRHGLSARLNVRGVSGQTSHQHEEGG